MKEKRECKVVQDLLPNYIEGLTSEETSKYIEEHIKECSECRKILEKMQKEIKIDEPKRQEKEIDYIKKYNKKLKAFRRIQIVVLIVLLIYVGTVVCRMITLARIKKVGNELVETADNYHRESYIYASDHIVFYDIYYKTGKILAKCEVYSKGANCYDSR